jgi:tRNA 2-thiouridine synthesizing protein A
MEEVDVTGEVCPRPALIVRDRLAELDPGEGLVVTGDYPPAEENLKRTCTKHGFEVREAGGAEGNAPGDGFELRIRVTEDAAEG